MKTIKVELFKRMLFGGGAIIEKQYEYINDLNVFPVPDGDTGTNMKVTVLGALDTIKEIEPLDPSVIGQKFSRGLLMSARGNSGVIFSQIIKGFVSTFAEGSNEITIPQLVQSFDKAREISYKAVATPVEGTILTVIRVTSEKILAHKKFESVEELFSVALREALIILEKTPEMLEELKEVGVVDSGGYGLCCFLEGMNAVLNNKMNDLINQKIEKKVHKKSAVGDFAVLSNKHETNEGFGYCSEIIMQIGAKIQPDDYDKTKFDLDNFRRQLEKIGNSLVCVQDSDIVKVHIHSVDPGQFLKLCQKYGEFAKVKFENMTNQFHENMERRGIIIAKPNEDASLTEKPAIIITVPSEKIASIMKEDYSLKYTINTEANGNPSIQDFLRKIQETKSRSVYIITDDSNIILAATQAADIARDNINVIIIPGKNIFEALMAGLAYQPNLDFNINTREMTKIAKNTVSAMVSTSIKNVQYKHITVKKNDYIGILNKKVLVSNRDEEAAVKETIDKLMMKIKQPDIAMLFYGQNASIEVVRNVEKYINEVYGCYCEVRDGNQKVYSYYIGLQ